MVYLTIPVMINDHLTIQVGWQLQQLPRKTVLYDKENNEVALDELRINTPEGIIIPVSVEQVLSVHPSAILDKNEDGYDRYLSPTIDVKRLTVDVLRLWLYDLIISGIGDDYVYPPDILAINPAIEVYNKSEIGDLLPNLDVLEHMVRTYSQHMIEIVPEEGDICALIRILDHHLVAEQEEIQDDSNA